MTETLTYRRIDTASKLLGLAFVAAGLEVGPATGAGVVLVLAGIAIGTATVFVNNE